MTEDDTYRALKRWPAAEVAALYTDWWEQTDHISVYMANEFLKSYGWTMDELFVAAGWR